METLKVLRILPYEKAWVSRMCFWYCFPYIEVGCLNAAVKLGQGCSLREENKLEETWLRRHILSSTTWLKLAAYSPFRWQQANGAFSRAEPPPRDTALHPAHVTSKPNPQNSPENWKAAGTYVKEQGKYCKSSRPYLQLPFLLLYHTLSFFSVNKKPI